MKHYRQQTLTKAKKEMLRHQYDYLTLITGAVFFLVFLELMRGERFGTFIVLLAFASLYCVWGIVHHIRDNSLHLKSVLEYILISFSIVALVSLLLFY